MFREQDGWTLLCVTLRIFESYKMFVCFCVCCRQTLLLEAGTLEEESIAVVPILRNDLSWSPPLVSTQGGPRPVGVVILLVVFAVL